MSGQWSGNYWHRADGLLLRDGGLVVYTGSGIGCLILAVGYVVPLRHSGSATLLEVIGKKYGLKAEYFGSVLCSIGIFISVSP